MNIHIELVPFSERLPDPKVDSHILCMKVYDGGIAGNVLECIGYLCSTYLCIVGEQDQWKQTAESLADAHTHWLPLKVHSAAAPKLTWRYSDETRYTVWLNGCIVIGDVDKATCHEVCKNLELITGVEAAYE